MSVVVEVLMLLSCCCKYLLFILVHAAPPLESLSRVNPICGDGGVEKRATPVILWGEILVVLRLCEPLVGTFYLSTCVNYLLTLFVCRNEIDQRNHKSTGTTHQ